MSVRIQIGKHESPDGLNYFTVGNNMLSTVWSGGNNPQTWLGKDAFDYIGAVYACDIGGIDHDVTYGDNKTGGAKGLLFSMNPAIISADWIFVSRQLSLVGKVRGYNETMFGAYTRCATIGIGLGICVLMKTYIFMQMQPK